MADEKDGWGKRIKDVLDWARRVHWMWTLFPVSWKAALIASAIGGMGLVLALLGRANLAQAWLYFVGAFAMYGVSWACIQIARWLTGKDDLNRPRLSLWAPTPDGTHFFWRQYAYIFRLKNIGGRAARGISFQPVDSRSGTFELQLDNVSALGKDEQVPLGITVSAKNWGPIGQSANGQERSDPLALQKFVEDELPIPGIAKFVIVASYRDVHDKPLTDRFEMECRMPGLFVTFRPLPK